MSAADASPQAVTFDFWNTLIAEDPGQIRALRHARWLELLADHAGDDLSSAVERAFESLWRTFDNRWQANAPLLPPEAVDILLHRLEVVVPTSVRDALVETFTTTGLAAELHPTAGAGAALERLRSAGIRLGVVCDVGLTPSSVLGRVLERHGLAEHFDAYAWSDEVGCFKPDPRIFRAALAGLGDADPAAAAHVGDLRRTDVAGAAALGMTTVRYVGAHDDAGAGPEADHVVTDHADLAAVLGVD